MYNFVHEKHSPNVEEFIRNEKRNVTKGVNDFSLKATLTKQDLNE